MRVGICQWCESLSPFDCSGTSTTHPSLLPLRPVVRDPYHSLWGLDLPSVSSRRRETSDFPTLPWTGRFLYLSCLLTTSLLPFRSRVFSNSTFTLYVETYQSSKTTRPGQVESFLTTRTRTSSFHSYVSVTHVLGTGTLWISDYLLRVYFH